MSGNAASPSPTAAPMGPVRFAVGTDQRTSNSCATSLTVDGVHPAGDDVAAPVAEERRHRRELGDPRQRRGARPLRATGSCAMWTRPRQKPPRVSIVSQRVVRPYSLSDESSREKASAGTIVPRRMRIQTPRLSGAMRYSHISPNRLARRRLREALERAVQRRERHRARLVVEIVALDVDRLEPLLGDALPLVARRGT